MVYHCSWRLPTISTWKHFEALFNTLGSPVGGGGFNRYAHSAGPLFLRSYVPMFLETPRRCPRELSKHLWEIVICIHMGSEMEAKWFPNGSPEASWSLLAS